MPLPRFRVRTLMIAVAVLAVALTGVISLREAAERRSLRQARIAWHKGEAARCAQKRFACERSSDRAGAEYWDKRADAHVRRVCYLLDEEGGEAQANRGRPARVIQYAVITAIAALVVGFVLRLVFFLGSALFLASKAHERRQLFSQRRAASFVAMRSAYESAPYRSSVPMRPDSPRPQ